MANRNGLDAPGDGGRAAAVDEGRPLEARFLLEKAEGFFWGVFYLYGPAYQYLLTVFFEKTYFLQFWGSSFPMVFGVVFLGMGSGWRWRFCFMFLLVWIVQTDCLTIV